MNYCKTGKKTFAWLMVFAMIFNLLFLQSAEIKAAAASDVTVEITQSGIWSNGSSEYTMFNCVITNNTSASISNWTVTMPFASTATLD